MYLQPIDNLTESLMCKTKTRSAHNVCIGWGNIITLMCSLHCLVEQRGNEFTMLFWDPLFRRYLKRPASRLITLCSTVCPVVKQKIWPCYF